MREIFVGVKRTAGQVHRPTVGAGAGAAGKGQAAAASRMTVTCEAGRTVSCVFGWGLGMEEKKREDRVLIFRIQRGSRNKHYAAANPMLDDYIGNGCVAVT